MLDMFLHLKHVGVCSHLKFRIHKEYPASQRFQVHLEDKQQVYFNETDILEEALDNVTMYETTLTAWFKINRANEFARTFYIPIFLNILHENRQINPENERLDKGGLRIL
jgi:hypothetical protein